VEASAREQEEFTCGSIWVVVDLAMKWGPEIACCNRVVYRVPPKVVPWARRWFRAWRGE
jgi:hypothetical protein